MSPGRQGSPSATIPTPSGTAISTSTPAISASSGKSDYGGIKQFINPTTRAQMDNVSNLTKSLLKKPYNGTHFSLSYDIDSNRYILYLDRGAQTEARQEFKNYLKQYGLNAEILKELNQTIVTYVR